MRWSTRVEQLIKDQALVVKYQGKQFPTDQEEQSLKYQEEKPLKYQEEQFPKYQEEQSPKYQEEKPLKYQEEQFPSTRRS